jgi:hypothetical protein
MQSSGVLYHVALVRTNVLEEHRFLQDQHGVTSQKIAFFVSIIMFYVFSVLTKECFFLI